MKFYRFLVSVDMIIIIIFLPKKSDLEYSNIAVRKSKAWQPHDKRATNYYYLLLFIIYY